MIAHTTTQEDSSTTTPNMPGTLATDVGPAFAAFVGVDLHKCTVSLSAADAGGQIIARFNPRAEKCTNHSTPPLTNRPGRDQAVSPRLAGPPTQAST